MITALYLIMIVMCVAKGRSTSQSSGEGGDQYGMGAALHGGVRVGGFVVRGNDENEGGKNSQQMPPMVETESQIHHTVYKYVQYLFFYPLVS